MAVFKTSGRRLSKTCRDLPFYLLLPFLSAHCSSGQTLLDARENTLQLTSRLVVLDVTVVNKKGQPVRGLTQDDFEILDSDLHQRISSFEGADSHRLVSRENRDQTLTTRPTTILVLDLLNSTYADFASLRMEIERYLLAQPALLPVPFELMVLDNTSLKTVQQDTQDKEALLSALKRVPGALPFKLNPSFLGERFMKSTSALQQIALENKGVAGRKNVIWVGQGGPSIAMGDVIGKSPEWITRYMHKTTNLLVDSRTALFLLHTSVGLGSESGNLASPSASREASLDHLSQGLSFAVFIRETGGKFFYNRNDVQGEIQEAQDLGLNFYTLTYHPPIGREDDSFHPIRVVLHNPELRAITKSGYFSPEAASTPDTRRHVITDINEAVQSALPFDSLETTLGKVVRHPDTGTAEFIVNLGLRGLTWQQEADGREFSALRVAAAATTREGSIVASKLERVVVESPTSDIQQRASYSTSISLTLRITGDTKNVRLVLQSIEGGRLGSVDVPREAIQSASTSSTPVPTLNGRPPYRR